MLLSRVAMLLSQHVNTSLSLLKQSRSIHQVKFHLSLLPQIAASNSSTAAATAVSRTLCSTASTGPTQHITKPEASTHQSREVSSTAVGMLLPPLPSLDAAADSLAPLSLEETLQAVAIPPTGQNLGPRVEHIHIAATGLLSDAVASALQLPQSFVLELIRFGAVHYCPVMPQPSPKAAPRMSPGHLQRMRQLRADGIARHGKSPKLQVPRRMAEDCTVEQGGYIRVHVHPKRFPAAYSVDWRQCVLADRAEYVVVDKPAGVQVPPTVDNMLENVVALTAAALGLPPDALLNTHRLDVGTSGVVVLAKTQGFAAWFSTLLKDKADAVVKTYRCLTANPPPLGPIVHWAVVKQRAAGEPAHTRMLLDCAVPDAYSSSSGRSSGGSSGKGGGLSAPGVEGAVRCELIVEQVQVVSLTGSAAAEWGPTAYETTLQLVTGRTHQIRAQMAAVGCPLLGDQLYTALATMWQQEQQQQLQQASRQQQQQVTVQQQPSSLEQQQANVLVEQQQCAAHPKQQQQQQQHDSQHSQPQHRHAGAHWSKIYQEDPSRPIGLQAARLKVRNVAGRMTSDVAVGSEAGTNTSTEQVQGGRALLVGDGVPGAANGQPEWVEFEAGTPWWRA